MKASDIIEALRKHHCPPEWVFFDEMRCGTGYGPGVEKRLDAWAMRCFRGAYRRTHSGLVRVAYEVKVSRSDWLRELKPDKWTGEPKRKMALYLSNLLYFAVPAHLVKPLEVPEDNGLVYVGSDGSVDVVKEAPFREIEPPPLPFLASVARRSLLVENGEQTRNIRKLVPNVR